MLIVIKGKPVGKQRPRFTKRGTVYTPKETSDYEKQVAALYKAAKGEMLEGNLKLIIEAYYPIPTSAKKTDKDLMKNNIIRPYKSKPDIDNVVKIILDGLNGVAFKDDVAVVSIVANKYYSTEPRVEVSIYKL